MYFLPYADVLLRPLAVQTLVLVRDGSGVGRGCTALMLHVVYTGRALRGLARARSLEGPLARSAPYRLGRPEQRADPSRDAGGVARRWRMRWDETPAKGAARGRGLTRVS